MKAPALIALLLSAVATIWFTGAEARGAGASGGSGTAGGANRLIHEKSPYLLQHKDNPIWWYAWGDEAFRAARERDLPIFLSIGYSSCHWCHVMNGESFSNPEVARLMNEHFIAILVDREERPDVDLAYQPVVAAMAGQVGWPMTLFLTPDGKPFMGGSFIPRRQLLRMLGQFARVWREERGRIEAVGRQVTQRLQKDAAAGFSEKATGARVPDEALLRGAFARLLAAFDPEYGGFGRRSKFLPPMRLSLLLRIHKRTGNPKALEMAVTTLDAMARGGVYDQLGGGFHRYATDREWGIPHFEKMLPENALMAGAYLEGFQATGQGEYRQVAREILDYVLRVLTHPEGGFFASEDADSERTEGKFYAWTLKALKDALTPEEFRSIVETYHPTEAGNYNPWLKDVEENAGHAVVRKGNVLHLRLGQQRPDGRNPLLKSARRKLLQVRARRPRPGRDGKILTAWYGLMIAAMARGYQALGDPRYLRAAKRAARFVLARLRGSKGHLLRSWSGGEARQRGFLNDYAFLIRGLLELYQSDFDPAWIDTALQLQARQKRLFWDEARGAFLFSAPATGRLSGTMLPRRPVFLDETLPSGNAISALNLLQLADLTLRHKFRARAAEILAAGAPLARKNPANYPQLLIALDYLTDRSKEIAVIGPLTHPASREMIGALQRAFLPNKVLAASLPKPLEDKTPLALLVGRPMMKERPTAYVCENNICRLPTTELEVVKKLVNEQKPYALEVKLK
ncbi:MAG: thioredoxin domain-containing protein [bacterium]